PGAEVSQDDQLVAELLRPFNDVVQMRVTELVDLLLAVLGPEERHLGNQDLRVEDGGETVETCGGRIPAVAHERNPLLAADLDAAQPQVADLGPVEMLVLGLELLAPLPHDVPARRDGVPGFEGSD